MKRTLIVSADSCKYYFIVLEDGREVNRGDVDWCDFENDADGLIDTLKKENGEFDYIYWI